MKTTEIKEYVFKALKPLVESDGFESFTTGMDPTFVKRQCENVYHFFFNFKSYGDIEFSKYRITNYFVEDVLLEVKFPNLNFDPYYKKEKYNLPTIRDLKTNHNGSFAIDSMNEIKTASDWIVNYLQNEGQAFIDHYSYLPNVLKEMDRLEAEGINWQNRKKGGILAGSLDAYFRGLIISKLCNDPNFDKKLTMTDEKFATPGYEEWMPYYQKLTKKLKTIEPKYNI